MLTQHAGMIDMYAVRLVPSGIADLTTHSYCIANVDLCLFLRSLGRIARILPIRDAHFHVHRGGHSSAETWSRENGGGGHLKTGQSVAGSRRTVGPAPPRPPRLTT